MDTTERSNCHRILVLLQLVSSLFTVMLLPYCPESSNPYTFIYNNALHLHFFRLLEHFDCNYRYNVFCFVLVI